MCVLRMCDAMPTPPPVQVKLLQPADIEASVALRAEQDAFWPRSVSAMLAALLRAGGHAGAAADEYFSQVQLAARC